MRGSDMRTGELFSYVDLEKRVPEHHPLQHGVNVAGHQLALVGRMELRAALSRAMEMARRR